MAKDKAFIENEIKPNVIYIDSFKRYNGRLPTIKEFNEFKGINDSVLGNTIYVRNYKDMPREVSAYPKNINWDIQYVLWIWRGEWGECYTSWDNHYSGNNYSWGDSYVALTEMLFIGIIPFLFAPVKRMIRNHKNRVQH